MDHQNNNQDLNLVLFSDVKPKLKWTAELHDRFVDAVTRLGGPEKATPKSLMRLMSISGLTLYHLKSRLQNYRRGKIQQSPACSGKIQEEFADDHRSDITSIDHNDETPKQINESLNVAQALHMQMEVQRELHEQIEVQRHLQLRMEAQGKYLQSLKTAHDTLAGYNLSILREVENSTSKEENPKPKSSLKSSLTSSESSGRSEKDNLGLSNFGNGRKRANSNYQGKRLQFDSKRFVLNSQYVNGFDFESKSNTLDLNSKLG